MDFSILPQDLTFRKATLSQNVRRRSVRARLPPIATFSHNLFEIKTSNRRPATHDTAPGWKCVTSRSSRFFCEQPGCVYALNKVPFKFKCRLNQHLLSHQTVGRFKCPSCDNIFKTKENLVRHSRLHQNAKPYTCEVCDRSFARTSDRSCCRKHHSLCSKSNTATDLKQLEHMSALDKELALNRSKPRPYVCKICGDRRSYTDPGSLRKHKRRYHQDSVGIAPSNKENLSRSSAMFCSGTCVGSHPPLPHSKANNLSEPLLSNSSCQMVDACVSTDQTLLDHSLIEPRLYPNGFLLPSSPVPEFASWPAQPSDSSFSERHQEPASDLVSSNGQELFTGFHPEEHLVFHQPSSPVDLCKSALCLQVVPYGDELQLPQLDSNAGSSRVVSSLSEFSDGMHFHSLSGCCGQEVALDLTETQQYFTVYSSSEAAIDLSGCSRLAVSTPMDLSAAHNSCDPSVACDLDLSLLTEDRSALSYARSAFSFSWDPEPGFSFTDLLASAELDEAETCFQGPFQESPLNYSPIKPVYSAPPPLDLRLIHPSYM